MGASETERRRTYQRAGSYTPHTLSTKYNRTESISFSTHASTLNNSIALRVQLRSSRCCGLKEMEICLYFYERSGGRRVPVGMVDGMSASETTKRARFTWMCEIVWGKEMVRIWIVASSVYFGCTGFIDVHNTKTSGWVSVLPLPFRVLAGSN